jgi:hypothetical protein
MERIVKEVRALQPAGRPREVVSMRQVQLSKRHRPAASRLDLLSREPLPLDPRDPDIVRAKELARRGTRGERPARRSRQPG